MTQLIYAATVLKGTGKRGHLRPDADGYYRMPVGGLNVYNNLMEFYEGTDEVLELFKSSSILQRRIENGRCFAEVGHPAFEAGMTEQAYVARILQIRRENVCAHIRRLDIDYDYGKNNPEYQNPNLIGLIGELKPFGARGPELQESFDNPDTDVCFSIRSLIRERLVRRQKIRTIYHVTNFDWVVEPGLKFATKWHSKFGLENLADVRFEEDTLTKIENACIGYGFESTSEIAEVIKSVKIMKARPASPVYARW